MTFRRYELCRICGGKELHGFLSLGESPLANSFLDRETVNAPERRYPLGLVFCRACALVALSVVVAPEEMFREYIYVSGTSDTMPKHFASLAAELQQRFALAREGLTVEIGSNDGTLLKALQAQGFRVLGVEPAANLARLARNAGLETVNEFFSAELGSRIRADYGMAQAILANNVVAHIDDIKGLVAGVRELLSDKGVAIFEVPYLGDLLENVEYDTVYHEHLSYFSLAPLERLMAHVGLRVFDVRRIPVHGGSLRVYADLAVRAPSDAVALLRESELALRLNALATYEAFSLRVRRQRGRLRALLRDLRQSGKRIAGYGAPAKSTTLLNYCEIGRDLLEFVVDRNSLKHGRYVPGVRIPVRPVDVLVETRPDYLLLLAWNFAEEIMIQQRAYRDSGGKFIHPLPLPRIY